MFARELMPMVDWMIWPGRHLGNASLRAAFVQKIAAFLQDLWVDFEDDVY